eukprot:CAMPEP_0116563188 /NCGR_PEP_ID=MMETSP0397-20121206/12588_1 /TAXON_ID=216820 /ORGANISM="Cyclophora tenuis, Strain ECT3854" /LENGTH=133 /DNA_ID=CAMNT_0004089591 /DNA_START=131 /DNA_END=532 /DNA_ORIENTATION=-
MANNDENNDMLHRICSNDVLCSTIPRYVNHVGNQDYALAVAAYLLRHPRINLARVDERVAASRDIVGIIRYRRGRFLAKTRRGTWKEIGDELALRWVSRQLRRMVEHDARPPEEEQEEEQEQNDEEEQNLVVA